MKQSTNQDGPCDDHVIEAGLKCYDVATFEASFPVFKYSPEDPNRNNNLIEIVLTLKEPIQVDCDDTKNIQISFRATRDTFKDCADNPAKQASYWQYGSFHFVEYIYDSDLPTVLETLMTAKQDNCPVSIEFDPKNIKTTWYKVHRVTSSERK